MQTFLSPMVSFVLYNDDKTMTMTLCNTIIPST